MLQKKGPALAAIRDDLGELDAVAGDLIDFYEARGARVIVLSEYGIVPVSRPVHLNRVLREAGLIAYREELGREVLDVGGSEAFAVADHQIAHVYVNDPARIAEVRELLEARRGVGEVLDEAGKREYGLDHAALRRAGADRRARTRGSPTTTGWTTRRRRTTRARSTSTASPATTRSSCSSTRRSACRRWPSARGSSARKLGFRTLLDVIPLDATLVKGSHGRIPDDPAKRAAADHARGGPAARTASSPPPACTT